MWWLFLNRLFSIMCSRKIRFLSVPTASFAQHLPVFCLVFFFFPVLHWVVPFRMCGADNQTERQMVNKTKRNWDCDLISQMCSIRVLKVYTLTTLHLCYAGTVHGALRTERGSENKWLSWNETRTLIRWKMRRIFLH